MLEDYGTLIKKIIEPIAAESLLSWVYGRFTEEAFLEKAYYNESQNQLLCQNLDIATLLFETAKKKLITNPLT